MGAGRGGRLHAVAAAAAAAMGASGRGRGSRRSGSGNAADVHAPADLEADLGGGGRSTVVAGGSQSDGRWCKVNEQHEQETGRLISDSPVPQLYIMYMDEKEDEDPNVLTTLHYDTLSSVLGSKVLARASLLYSYKYGFSGFAAMLTDSQAKLVARMPGVLGVEQSGTGQMATTRSCDFLGLTSNPRPSELLRKAKLGHGVIIGGIDTEDHVSEKETLHQDSTEE
uniref:Cucumisin n=1 Tax=Anthurium amnicola TaxID=1678845 RepID=A0A1D1YG44_9ARAE